MLYVAGDTALTAVDAANISKFDIVFNQADTPYSVPADFIKYKNDAAYGSDLPAGAYVFDFTDQGMPNYGEAETTSTQKD
jgi:hypothetical protein